MHSQVRFLALSLSMFVFHMSLRLLYYKFENLNWLTMGWKRIKVNLQLHFHRLCLKPLLHDLPSTSFSANLVSLANPWYLNSKGIYSASFVTYMADGTFMTNEGNSSEIDLWGKVQIVIKLPKVSLIKGIWWSTYNQDSYNGIIVKIGKLHCYRIKIKFVFLFSFLIIEFFDLIETFFH